MEDNLIHAGDKMLKHRLQLSYFFEGGPFLPPFKIIFALSDVQLEENSLMKSLTGFKF